MFHYCLNQWLYAFLWIYVHLPLTSTTLTEDPLSRHSSIAFFQIWHPCPNLFVCAYLSRYQVQKCPISLPGPDYLAPDFPIIFAVLNLPLSHKFCVLAYSAMLVRRLSELFFLIFLWIGCRAALCTSCLWRVRGKRWQRWIRLRRWTLSMLTLLSLRFLPFRRRRRICRWGWRSTSIAALTLWLLVFVWIFRVFVFGSTSSPFQFFIDTLRRDSSANFPLVFGGTIRVGLLIALSQRASFLWASSVVSDRLLPAIDESNITGYRCDKIF